MTITVHPVTPPAITSIWVTSYRFLFELHTQAQQIALDVAHTEAMGLSVAEMASTDPALMSTNGYPVQALVGLRLAYEMMDKLPGKVDILSADMNTFFFVAKACGVYGLDETAANAEIARIQSNTPPA
jgi:hypothetical protein